MRRGRRYLAVPLGGTHRLIGECREVIGVNDVVRQAWMIRLGPEELLEDGAGLPLFGVGLVVG